MKYNLKDNGDLLEKTYSQFILSYLPTYEKVWQLYIGNIGDDTKAKIPGYPPERKEKRQTFSEHTYTVLQSIVLMNRLLEKKAFEKTPNDLEKKLDLHEDILLFFSHVGRIRDNITDAATCLLNIDIKKLEEQFDGFYHTRHIPVHGRIIPIIFKRNGEVEMPVLSKNDEDPTGWNHKTNNWPDILHMPSESINSATQQLFWELIQLLVDVFGRFADNISEELNSKGLELKFEYNTNQTGVSGYRQKTAASIYGISLSDGRHGSSSF
jgi:hypothetical protein